MGYKNGKKINEMEEKRKSIPRNEITKTSSLKEIKTKSLIIK